MAYIGNSLTQQSFTGGMDQFNGNASNTTFGLSRTISTAFDVNVYVEGVYQRPGVAYTTSANTITFTSAPSTGANNIVVVYENFTSTSIVPAPGSVITQSLGLITNINAGAGTGMTLQANSANAIAIAANGNVSVGTSPGSYRTIIQANNANILSVTTTGSFARPIISTQSTSGDPETSLQFADGANRSYYMGIYYPAASYKRFYFDNRTGTDTSFEVDGVTKLSISNTGVVYVNSGQLKFPATQAASTDSNTLDDYEEGTWTPFVAGSTTNPTVTYGVQRGVYTKVGNIVHCTWQITFSGLTGGSGYGMIGGFPFTAASGSATQPGYSSGAISESPAALSFGAGKTHIAHELTGGDTRAYFTFMGSGVDQSVQGVAAFTGSQYYVGSLTYRAA